jgi:hypothetical protein
MTLGTIDGQWSAMLRNLGAWEGSLARYDPGGTELGPRQNTIVYVYGDDPGEIREGPPRSTVVACLRRCDELFDGSEVLIKGSGQFRSRVFDADGRMSACMPYLSLGIRAAFELILNYTPTPGGAIARRTRGVVFYDESGHLSSLAVFRERPLATGDETTDVRTLVVRGPSLASSQHAAATDAGRGSSDAEFSPQNASRAATAAALAAADGGAVSEWRGTYSALGPRGLCAEGVAYKRDAWGGGGGGGADGFAADGLAGVTDGSGTHVAHVGGGAYFRLGLSSRTREGFAVEMGWLAAPGLLLRNRIEYDDGAWLRSVFATERRVGH